MRVVSVINQKGGVGKTTTTLNLAHALAQQGLQLLAVDLDPQAHLTAGFGALQAAMPGIADVLLDDEDPQQVCRTVRENLDLIPAGSRLGELEHLTEGGARRGWLLQAALQQLGDGYDMVLIDCPPSSGILGINALLACDEVLIPVAGDFFSLQGLARLMEIFGHIEATLQRNIDKRVVLTRFHERRRLAREVQDKILAYFPDQVLRTPIRESVALAESPGFGQTIFEYQRRGNGASDYLSLARDILHNRTMTQAGTPTASRAG